MLQPFHSKLQSSVSTANKLIKAVHINSSAQQCICTGMVGGLAMLLINSLSFVTMAWRMQGKHGRATSQSSSSLECDKVVLVTLSPEMYRASSAAAMVGAATL